MRRLFEHLKANGSLDGMYGMSLNKDGTPNIDEFVAEAFTNPKFQQALMSIPAPSGSSLKSAWEWFVGMVARIIGYAQASTGYRSGPGDGAWCGVDAR
jgi:hypothetical protein